MKITAKVRCYNRVTTDPAQDIVYFNADYSDKDGTAINQEWARWTPGLSITMGVRKTVPFEAGKSYTLTFDDGE